MIIDEYVEWLDGIHAMKLDAEIISGWIGENPTRIAERTALMRKAWKCPELRARHRATVLRVRGAPEARAKTSADSKARWACPVYREMMSSKYKAAWVLRKARND